MFDKLNIVHKEIQLPSEYADSLGIMYSKQVSHKHKKSFGQFLTPIPIAKLMASFCNITKSSIRVLDPGCGTAILSCSLIEKIAEQNNIVENITLEVYETDTEIIPFTQESLNYLKDWVQNKGISFEYILHIKDFILEKAHTLNNSNELLLFETDNATSNIFDIIISNPPYFKLSKDDKRAIAAQRLVSGQPNIYALFMGIAAKLLCNNGELIFITPRSYASGNYFKAFRELFFNTVQVQRIHLFNSRKETFDRDNVLQETIIINAKREKTDIKKEVIVSTSVGIKDIFNPNISTYKTEELINLKSKEIILHLPTSNKEEKILNLISTWKCKLADLDISISTGPVVSFRAEKFIQNNFENGSVFLAPLFWLHNVNKMILDWPKQFKEKGQYIRIEENSRSLLIPNRNYIFLRRFSTKDDKSRLIAAPYFCNYFQSDVIGVENKVNYLYRKKGHLERSETVGLCALLNSEFFDTYFRIFNGNVNVSATELREMLFPTINELKELGNKIILSNDYSVINVNNLVNEVFELELILNKNE